MKLSQISGCYLGPAISPEQYVPEHFCLFLRRGRMRGFDGHQGYLLEAGEGCLVVRHRLARYSKQPDQGVFEKVVIVFDEAFLRRAQTGLESGPGASPAEAFVRLPQHPLIEHYLQSLQPYYTDTGQLDADFAELKRLELLRILLRLQPELGGLLFDFAPPDKVALADFMQRHFKFNVPLARFAWLSGRSLSGFKRDFEKVFQQPPGRWLLQRRLEEAHFLLAEQGARPSDIYLELGFEDFSHFSHAFKRRFGYAPSQIPVD